MGLSTVLSFSGMPHCILPTMLPSHVHNIAISGIKPTGLELQESSLSCRTSSNHIELASHPSNDVHSMVINHQRQNNITMMTNEPSRHFSNPCEAINVHQRDSPQLPNSSALNRQISQTSESNKPINSKDTVSCSSLIFPVFHHWTEVDNIKMAK